MSKNNRKVPKLRFPGFDEEWEEKKLGELGKVLTGSTPKTTEKSYWTNEKNGYVWITPSDITSLVTDKSERMLSELGWKISRKVPKNSVLITSIASIGKNTTNVIEVSFNQQINAIIPEKNNYLFILNSMESQIQKFAFQAGNTATPIINKTEFEKYTILVPCIDEQKMIGTLFGYFDNRMRAHQQKIDNLKKLKVSLLQKMFPKFNTEFPEIRFPEFINGWETKKMKNVATIFDGTHQTPKYTAKGVKFVSVENISNLESEKYITNEAYEKEYSNKRAETGDVLMTRIGNVGLAKMIEDDAPLAYYVTLALLKPKKIDSYFLTQLISNPEVQKDIWKKTLHVAFPKKINLGEIEQIMISVPSIEEQQQIGEFFTKIDNLISINERKFEHLQSLKKALLQQMFI